jgi:hypothetical protein
MKLTADINLEPRHRMSGAIYPHMLYACIVWYLSIGATFSALLTAGVHDYSLNISVCFSVWCFKESYKVGHLQIIFVKLCILGTVILAFEAYLTQG